VSEVFLDSGVFVAYLVRSDRLHAESARLFAQPPARWCTSVLVVAETYGWFLHKLGEETARTYRAFLRSLSDLEVLSADDAHFARVWEKLDALRGTKLTLTDASSLVHVSERGIGTVWGTDHHLGIEGATVVPGSPIA
jgi:predicted nucleic acid-binding protein